MNTTDSQNLLLAYTREGSEGAFQELVNRYVDLVFSVALRRVGGNTHLAEDVTQQVFTDLARKASSLPRNVMLGGWLHRHTGFVASTAVRGELRRRNRERLAVEMNTLNGPSDEHWKQLAPVLDVAMDELDATDRDALVLRYFERLELRAVGAVLGVNDDAARKRVSRAVEKLRDLLARHGVTMLSAAALSVLVESQSVQAAPMGFGMKVGKAALKAAGAAGGAGGLAALWKFLTPTIAKLMTAAAVVLVSAGLIHYAGANRKTEASSHAESSRESKSNVLASVAKEGTNDSNSNVAAVASSTNTNVVRLIILADDTGQPVPNAKIHRSYISSPRPTNAYVYSDRAGACDIPKPPRSPSNFGGIGWETKLSAEGFADTSVRWRSYEAIPASYTVRLVRPVSIGGFVMDADGQPVEGAEVAISDWPSRMSSPKETDQESHQFGEIHVTTDSAGHWTINRIAPDMIHLISGFATHPLHVTSYLSGLDPVTEKQFREGTYTFHLERAITARGMVVDSEGSPIRGANVSVGPMRFRTAINREVKSSADGSFEAVGCKPGTNFLTAQMEGFAATMKQVVLTPDSEPFRITLQKGKVLRMRVLSSDGKAIARETVSLENYNPRFTAPEANFRGRTDADGRLVWTNAPDGNLIFQINPSGYEHTNVCVAADGEEHVITLAPEVPQAPSEHKETDPGVLVTVLSPDGFPVEGADVAFVPSVFSRNNTGNVCRFSIAPGGFVRDPFCPLQRTDGEGHFRLQSNPTVTRIIAAHPDGYGETTLEKLAGKPVLTLQPWGKLEGTYIPGGQPSPDCKLRLDFNTLLPEYKESLKIMGLDKHTFTVNTDARGHFVFPKVLPGKFVLSREMPASAFSYLPGGASSLLALSDDIEIHSGETSTLNLRESSYTVKVRLRWPENVQPGKNLKLTVTLGPPLTAMKQAIQAAQNGGRVLRVLFPTVVDGDSLTVENVPAGDFQFSAFAMNSQSFPELKGFSSIITVPSDPPTGTIDAGEIVLTQIQPPSGK